MTHPLRHLADREGGEHVLGQLDQGLGTAEVRRGIETGKFHRPGEAQAVLHGRRIDLRLSRDHGQGRCDSRSPDRRMVSALAFQRHADAEAHDQRSRPCPRGDHDAVGDKLAVCGPNAGNAALPANDPGHPVAFQVSAVARELLGQVTNQAVRVGDESVVGQENPVFVIGRQFRDQLAKITRPQHPLAYLAFLAQAPLALAFGQAPVRLVDGECPCPPNQVLAARIPKKGPVILERVGMERQQRVGKARDFGRPPGEDETDKPRQGGRQIARPDSERAQGVGQPPRNLGQHPGSGQRHATARAEGARVPLRAAFARPLRIDEHDVVTVAQQITRRARADNTGADHNDLHRTVRRAGPTAGMRRRLGR